MKRQSLASVLIPFGLCVLVGFGWHWVAAWFGGAW